MLENKELMELKEHLENAKAPVFFYDNDCDGLCSFLLLRRWLGRGYGVAIRSYPELNKSYARKAKELNADYVFVLDKPILSQEFVDSIREFGLPLVWIDHHKNQSEGIKKDERMFFEYNLLKKEIGEPVSYVAYNITENKEDIWLAIIGCIADHYLPDFSDEFKKKYKSYWVSGKVKEPFDVLYGSEIGEIARSLNFGLKDSVTNVVGLQKFLIDIENPSEILEETDRNKEFRKKYFGLKKKYDILLDRAEKEVEDWGVFFIYSGEVSMSSDLANELSYKNKGKYIAVGYKNQGVVNFSIRGKNVLNILESVLAVVGGKGGGHNDAVGARISFSELDKFRLLFVDKVRDKMFV